MIVFDMLLIYFSIWSVFLLNFIAQKPLTNLFEMNSTLVDFFNVPYRSIYLSTLCVVSVTHGYYAT